MAIRSLNRDKLYAKLEVESYYDHHPAVTESRQCGTSHKVYKGPRGSFVVPTGPGDCPRGMLRSILTQAAAAGVFALALALVIRAVA